jgi:Tol biopolymer transport system component
LVLLTSIGLFSRTRPPLPPADRTIVFTVDPPEGGAFTATEGSVQTPQLALSPDGAALAFVAANGDGVSQLWIRRIESPVPKSVPGTTDATYPFWSFDGQSLGFFARGELRRIDLSGGPSRAIAAAPDGRGGSWSGGGTILFAPDTTGVIYRVPADGGTPQPQTRLEAGRLETSHRWPQFLPGGREYIYFARSSERSHEGIYLDSLQSTGPTLLLNTSSGAGYAPPGRILYLADRTLMMQAVDLAERRTTGEPRPIAENVGASSNYYGAFSVSSTGVVAYANVGYTSQLVWFDRHGRRQTDPTRRGGYVDFDLSTDDRMVAVAEIDPDADRSDVYLLDMQRGSRLRLTAARETDASPVWAPDGSRLVFRSNRDRVHDLFARALQGSDPEQIFFKSPLFKYPTSWAHDGSSVLFHAKSDNHWDIWRAPVGTPSATRRLIQTPFDEVQGQLSPDGGSVAYTSNESSVHEVYLAPADGAGRRWLVSAGGGSDPKWRSDGKELFYLDPGGRLMSVAVAGGGTPPGSPEPLFAAVAPVVAEPYTSVYDVARDGSRFLFRVPVDDVRTLPLRVRLTTPALGQP